MNRSILAGALALLAVGAAPSALAQSGYGQSGYGQSGYNNDNVLRCESADGRQRFCQADTRGGVRLLRQLSRTPCVEGQSWGSDRRGVWVDQGCRGEFALQRSDYGNRYPGNAYPGNGYPGNGNPGYGQPGNGYPGNGYGNTFRCESTNDRMQQCATNGRRVELVRQLSERPCVNGRTWGTSNQGVWVTGGCRAEFRARGQGNGWGNMQPQMVRCESTEGRQQVCPANTRGGVRLARQLSRVPCVEGSSWGRTRDGIWVDRGCRAEFETGGRRGDRRYGDDG